ncbi:MULTISPECIES: hypothetical protein [Parabacteroides]|uniref:hypothetical protein n=1 Tax=Parabacteroides leei TaxID=2939491 RepID=UPI001899DAED|nr:MULTISPECIES: hypothetical protein [Parabacteroides]MCL3849867.1 hypothetical protein [Parabacteroides leei]
MWNKLMIGLLLLLGSQVAFSQTWLKKTDKEILQYTTDNKERIKDIQQTDTLFTMTYQEEDELGRLFEVSYLFNMKNNICTSYERLLPAHRYWAANLLEQVSLQEADASGEEIEVDGEILNAVYTFGDYRIHVSLKENSLSLFYTLSDK